MAQEIKTIVLDFGGVLIDLVPERSFDAFKALGIHDIEEMLNPYRQKGIFYLWEMGHLSPQQFAEKLSQHCGHNISVDEARKALLLFVEPADPKRFQFLEQLREQFPLYILSNNNPFVWDHAHSSDFLPNHRTLSSYVEKAYSSHQWHAMKPDPELYQIMIKDAGLTPQETLFVDDGVRNIEMAKEMGFHTLLAKEHGKWIEDLQALLQSHSSNPSDDSSGN